MANICIVSFEFVFATEEDKLKAFKVFAHTFNQLTSNVGAYIGSDRYLFDPNLRGVGKTCLVINGWVKWALEREEIKDILKYLSLISDVRSMSCHYDESSSDVFGKYVYEDNKLLDYYLTPAQFASIYLKAHEDSQDEDDRQDLYDKGLVDELADNPTVYVISSNFKEELE